MAKEVGQIHVPTLLQDALRFLSLKTPVLRRTHQNSQDNGEEEVLPAKPVQSIAVLCHVCFHLAASRAGESSGMGFL